MQKTALCIFFVVLSVSINRARGDETCRECRARYQSTLDRCRRAYLTVRECQARASFAFETCLDACGFIQSNIEEPPRRNPMADPEVVVSIRKLSANDGKVEFSLALDTRATGPFRKLVVGVASLAPDVCQIEGVRLGSGLLNYS